MIGFFVEKIVAFLSGRTERRFTIIKTQHGYLPLERNVVGLCAIERDGTLGVYMPDAAGDPRYHHKTEEGAGICVNKRARMYEMDVVWPKKT